MVLHLNSNICFFFLVSLPILLSTAMGDQGKEGECFKEKTAYPGGDIKQYKTNSPSECQVKCKETKKCFSFTWREKKKGCFLKKRRPNGLVEEIDDAVSGPKKCEDECFKEGTAYPGGDIKQFKTNSPSECQVKCKETKKCLSFTWREKKKGCFLKKRRPNGQLEEIDDAVSGPKICGENSCTACDGKECMFPFTYEGIVYNECTRVGRSEPWCATSKKRKGSWWSNCPEECPVATSAGMKPRQQYISAKGWGDCMAGWYDVQRQGANNDYCRWVGNCGCRNSRGGSCSWWSCALAGSNSQHTGKGAISELDTLKNGYTDCIRNPRWEGCAKIVKNSLPYLLQENAIKEGEIGVNNGSIIYRSCGERNGKRWETTLNLRKVGDIKTIKTDNEMIIINGTVTGHTGRKRYYGDVRSRQTGLYAGKGDLVTLTFPEELVGKVNINIGHHRWILNFEVKSSITKVGSPYGGLIIIWMKKNIGYKGEFTVNVTNAIRAPYFVYGRTTNEEWEEMKHYSPKWSVLIVPGQLDIFVQTLEILDIRDMNATMSRIKDTMDLLEESIGLPSGSQPGAERLIFSPEYEPGVLGRHIGKCYPSVAIIYDNLYKEDKDNKYTQNDDFFKGDGTNPTILHELGHGFCLNDLDDMGNQWTAETVDVYIRYVKGALTNKHNSREKMLAKDLDFFILERMVGFAMYSKGKRCGEAKFDKKQFVTGAYENCWKWLNWLPQKAHGWHIWKDVNTLDAKSTKQYSKWTDRMIDIYCQATKHNMLPMFNLWNIKPLDETITNNCEKLPESDLITKWVNIAKCVNQSMTTGDVDIRECGKMPRFPKHKGLCVMSGVCHKDETNNGHQTIMNKKFDLYCGTSRKSRTPFPTNEKEVTKELCFKRANTFFLNCKNNKDQPITATFYAKKQENEFNYEEFNYTYPPLGNCYHDRPLLMPKYKGDTATMIPEECNEKCKRASYSYFGVKYYNECWCGNNAPSAGKKLDPEKCDTMCKGDQKLRCGGVRKINIWKVCSDENCEFSYG